MKNGLVYLRPTQLAYVRVVGPYDQSIPEAWDKLLGWIDKNGLNSPIGRGYGLARDNPARVAADKCRYDACIQVMPAFEEKAMREIGVITLPPGPYTRRRQSGCYSELHNQIPTMHQSIKMPTGLRLDDNRPLVTIFLDDPHLRDVKDLRADICLPVSVMAARERTGHGASKAA
jgi:AraC family transcriptional regulator